MNQSWLQRCGCIIMTAWTAGCAPSKVTIEEDEAPSPLAEAQAHAWDSYRVDERLDDVACSGIDNATALIDEVYLTQTHMMAPDWPFFFLVADRPALIQLVVTGEGEAPEVSVTGFSDGDVLGTLCMGGPDALEPEQEMNPARRNQHFSVTLPAEWMQAGLSLEIVAGDSVESLDADTLGLLHAPELNLMLVMMDVLNYNHEDVDVAAFEPPASFLDDLGTSMPAAVTRLGHHAVRMPLPTMAVGSSEVPEGSAPVIISSRLCTDAESPSATDCDDTTPVGEWDLNAAALRFIDALQLANGHWSSHYYFGHTGALFPGGWGGGKTFVSGDYTWVTIHEMGHAASLPHWADTFEPLEPDDGQYTYPWGGFDYDGGGRGPTWSYIQDEDRFVSPICEVDWSENLGIERSDAMQRTRSCGEMRGNSEGPWDGFSDFSSLAMFRYMTGALTNQRGWVYDPLAGEEMAYNLPAQAGYPVMDWGTADPTYERVDPDITAQTWEVYDFWVPQERDRPVFTIYGTYHPAHPEATILYEPLYYSGDLPKVIDPTDPQTFKRLQKGMDGPYYDYFWWSKDLTFKITYRDGEVLHALYPYDSVGRDWTYGHGPWRWDMVYFGLNVPADKDIAQVALYERPFLVRYSDWTDEGNIANPDFGITAENFMDDAVLVAQIDL